MTWKMRTNDFYGEVLALYKEFYCEDVAMCEDRENDFTDNPSVSLTADTSPCTGEALEEVWYRVRGPPEVQDNITVLSIIIVLQSFNLGVWDYGPGGGGLPSGLEKVERNIDWIGAAFCGLAEKRPENARVRVSGRPCFRPKISTTLYSYRGGEAKLRVLRHLSVTPMACQLSSRGAFGRM